MTYEEMMTLTAHQLESQNVPKRARQRILLSIQKLRERLNILRVLEQVLRCSPWVAHGLFYTTRPGTHILDGGNLLPVLQELQQIIVTPIKALQRPRAAPPTNDTSDEAPSRATKAKAPAAPITEKDIPGLFTRVMGKVCTQLLNSWPDEKNVTTYLQLLEQCLSHEAFTETQKKRLRTWWWQEGWGG
ncbi:protein Smaug homolog 2-like [Athene noctua]|uniref:protein Smaug homolog 2-like n=1 Tax=Athene noctua TaxID=126797 RepID=UPI003EBF904A